MRGECGTARWRWEWLAMGMAMLLVAACNPGPGTAKATVYTCPMHPQVRQLEPGNCPLCGMKLVPEDQLGEPVGAEEKPAPRDGGAAETAVRTAAPSAPAAPAEGGKDETIYTCSMHPQIREPKPGNCPLCGMALVPVRKGAAQPAGSDLGVVVHLGPAQNAVASIRTVEAGPRTLTGSTEIFGEVMPVTDTFVHYNWYYGGRIQQTLIDYNTTEVVKGQPIYRVYSEGALADQEAYLKAVRERWLRTFYERTILNSEIATIAARLKQIGFTQEDLDQLVKDQKARSEFIIRAPATGSILAPLHHVGETFEPMTALIQVGSLAKVWFVADVYEKDLALLDLGQTIDITTTAHPGRKFQGKCVWIDRMLDPAKRSVKARFEVANPGLRLLPGLSGTGTLRFDLGESPVAMPLQAVIDTGRRKIVYIDLGDSAYAQRDVEIGFTGYTKDPAEGAWVQVRKGIKPGERVVVEGNFLIDAEAELQGLNKAAEQAATGGEGSPPPPASSTPAKAPAHVH